MNTTEITRTREYNIHQETGFSPSEYPLSYSLQIELADNLVEAFANENNYTGYDHDEIMYLVVDETMPAYYSEILREWTEAGCPEPDSDVAIDPKSSTIWQLITAGLYQAMTEFVYGLAGSSREESLERINTIYPTVYI